MMAISTQELHREFCKSNLKLENFEFSVEIQHGVFLLGASRIMLILDFNLGCFYSFCSLNQIQNFSQNNKKDANKFTFAFEIRNLPFSLNFSKPGNNNVLFQDGYLLWMCKKDNKPVLCRLKILIDQAALELEQLIDLSTGRDLLHSLPKEISDTWTLIKRKEEPEPIVGKLGNYDIIQEISSDSMKVRIGDDVFIMKKKKIGTTSRFREIRNWLVYYLKINLFIRYYGEFSI